MIQNDTHFQPGKVKNRKHHQDNYNWYKHGAKCKPITLQVECHNHSWRQKMTVKEAGMEIFIGGVYCLLLTQRTIL